MTPYATFVDKDAFFESYRVQTLAELKSRISELMNQGYYFRGQREACWKLVSAAQREWNARGLRSFFPTIHDFIEQHIVFQRSHETSQFTSQCSQLNDIAVLSTMQHFGGPTPFLDYTTNWEAALFFATDGAKPAGIDEISSWVSIYAWIPGAGAGTASTNDLFNWEKIIDRYGGYSAASEYKTLKQLSALYIKQDTGAFLEITNSRLRKQGGLFLYCSTALDSCEPYEAVFTGKTSDDVVDQYDGQFLPKMVCLDIAKSLIPQISAHLTACRVTKKSLGLDSINWSEHLFKQFLTTL